MRRTYHVTGMSCAACQARVEKAVSRVQGVTSCAVSLLTNSMGVEGGAEPGAVIQAVVCVMVVFHVAERYFLPWGMTWKTAAAAGAAFVSGGLFDTSYPMLGMEQTFETQPLFRLFCHAGNGLVFAAILLAFLWSLKGLKGIAGVDWRVILLLLVVLNVLTAVYILASRTVYYWDTAGYWSIARTLAAEPFSLSHVKKVVLSTIDLDYNYLLAFPISLVMRVFGGSRMVYLFCISNFYTFPALWGLAALAKKNHSALILIGLFPMLIYTGLDGFVDTGAAALAIWAYAVYLSDRPAIPRGLVSGALLVGSFLLRRYFFFFAASFGVAALTQKLLFERKRWKDFLALFFSCAACAVKFTYAFLLEKVLHSHYGDLYSAYAQGLSTDFNTICQCFGLAVVLVILVLGVLGLRNREQRPRLFFALFQCALCFGVFVGVQSHGMQHLLLYLPGLAFLASETVFADPRPVRVKQGLFAVLSAAVTVSCFFPSFPPTRIGKTPIPSVIPSFPSFVGERRDDIDALLALTEYLDSFPDRFHSTGPAPAKCTSVDFPLLSAPSLDHPQSNNRSSESPS